MRDPSTRIAQASSRGGFVRGERDRLAKELTTLRNLPRPKSISILSKSPVARPAAIGESHFELHRNRISYIDLDRLLELTKADAQVRIRMSDRVAAITNKVGPVGSFSLEYELLKAVPGSVEELLERKSLALRSQSLGNRPRVREPRRNLRGDEKPDFGIHPRCQPNQSCPRHDYVLGLPRQFYTLSSG